MILRSRYSAAGTRSSKLEASQSTVKSHSHANISTLPLHGFYAAYKGPIYSHRRPLVWIASTLDSPATHCIDSHKRAIRGGKGLVLMSRDATAIGPRSSLVVLGKQCSSDAVSFRHDLEGTWVNCEIDGCGDGWVDWQVRGASGAMQRVVRLMQSVVIDICCSRRCQHVMSMFNIRGRKVDCGTPHSTIDAAFGFPVSAVPGRRKVTV
ncbi:hypothetical protein BC629DRAFT_627279 [Irpex lacteus]|nr:hypothetical protein BC629DRAFT_627279 [Irpex lacteus]